MKNVTPNRMPMVCPLLKSSELEESYRASKHVNHEINSERKEVSSKTWSSRKVTGSGSANRSMHPINLLFRVREKNSWVEVQNPDVVLGTFLLLFSLDGLCTVVCGTLSGIFHLYGRTTLLSLRPFAFLLLFHFNLQLSTSRHSFLLFEFAWWIISDEERRVIGCVYAPRHYVFSLWPSFTHDILSFDNERLTWFDALHVSSTSDDLIKLHNDI